MLNRRLFILGEMIGGSIAEGVHTVVGVDTRHLVVMLAAGVALRHCCNLVQTQRHSNPFEDERVAMASVAQLPTP
jgi:hypothetical protein